MHAISSRNSAITFRSAACAQYKTIHTSLNSHTDRSGVRPSHASSALTPEDFQQRVSRHLKGDPQEVARFLSLCSYVQGSYEPNHAARWQALERQMSQWEAEVAPDGAMDLIPQGLPAPIARLFYLALPSTVYPQACMCARRGRT